MFLLNLDLIYRVHLLITALQYIMFVFVNCNKYNTSINRLCIMCKLRKRFLTICEIFCTIILKTQWSKIKEIKIKNLYKKILKI